MDRHQSDLGPTAASEWDRQPNDRHHCSPDIRTQCRRHAAKQIEKLMDYLFALTLVIDATRQSRRQLQVGIDRLQKDCAMRPPWYLLEDGKLYTQRLRQRVYCSEETHLIT